MGLRYASHLCKFLCRVLDLLSRSSTNHESLGWGLCVHPPEHRGGIKINGDEEEEAAE